MITEEQNRSLQFLRDFAEGSTAWSIGLNPDQVVTLVDILRELEIEIAYLKSHLEIE